VRVLVIEDQADIRATLQDILELDGHEVLAAADGVEGLAQLASKPDFIFCDIAMPRLDGYGVLEAVRQRPEVRDVPFVFLTAKAERSDRRAGMALGVDDYITKPFTERDILDAIAARTSRQHSIRERYEKAAEVLQRQSQAQWAHELLTPLNAVLGSVLMLEQEADTIDRGELKEILASIHAGAVRQDRLARQLIRYYELVRLRETPGAMVPYHCEATSPITAGCMRAMRENCRVGDVVVAAQPGEVGIHAEFLAHALYEVTGNALRYSAAGAKVTVGSRESEGRYRIEVEDRGPGLTAAQRAQVGAFVQFERQRHEQQGLGLGLAIARATAELAGGELRLEEGSGGCGLKVVFDLPSIA
jgi:CheY-like chemotaxis protein/anti-sigma regulatory factor (Ser/Thr protein kinase)